MDLNTPPRAPENLPPVTEADKKAVREHIACWKVAGEVMRQERDERTRNADTAHSIEVLSGALVHAVKTCPPRRTSGLVEQQRWFKKLRRQ